MKKLIAVFFFITIFSMKISQAKIIPEMDNLGFAAPTINGKSSASNVEAGAILFDTSDTTFYGNTSTTPASPSWVALNAATVALPEGFIIPYAGTSAPTGVSSL